MIKKEILSAIVLSIIIASCHKAAPDYATNWPGTYTSSASGDTLRQVAVYSITENIIQMQLSNSTDSGSTYHPFTTLTNVVLYNSTQGSFYVYDTISGYPDVYSFSGNAWLSGSSLNLQVTIADTVSSPSAHAYPLHTYIFFGSR